MAFVLSAVVAAPAFVPSTAAEQGIFERITTREVTVPAGTQLPIILDTSVASNTSRVEQPVRAHLSRDVRLDNENVIPAGSELYGTSPQFVVPGRRRAVMHRDAANDTVPRGSEIGAHRYRIARWPERPRRMRSRSALRAQRRSH
jgi:hypothetical protein